MWVECFVLSKQAYVSARTQQQQHAARSSSSSNNKQRARNNLSVDVC
jgi:hypothetical protein